MLTLTTTSYFYISYSVIKIQYFAVKKALNTCIYIMYSLKKKGFDTE